jgi:hypothetical protein
MSRRAPGVSVVLRGNGGFLEVPANWNDKRADYGERLIGLIGTAERESNGTMLVITEVAQWKMVKCLAARSFSGVTPARLQSGFECKPGSRDLF